MRNDIECCGKRRFPRLSLALACPPSAPATLLLPALKRCSLQKMKSIFLFSYSSLSRLSLTRDDVNAHTLASTRQSTNLFAASQSTARRIVLFLAIFVNVLSSRRNTMISAGLICSCRHSELGRISFMYRTNPRHDIVGGSYGAIFSKL